LFFEKIFCLLLKRKKYKHIFALICNKVTGILLWPNKCGYINTAWYIINQLHTPIQFVKYFALAGHHQVNSTFIIHLTVVTYYTLANIYNLNLHFNNFCMNFIVCLSYSFIVFSHLVKMFSYCDMSTHCWVTQQWMQPTSKRRQGKQIFAHTR
jgi:hypothetical protein